MSTSMKDGLDYILQAINNLIEPKLDKLRYDKTYRAKVTAIAGGGLYEVQIKNTKYNVSYSGALSIGDVVKVKAPLNNFSDIYIEGAQSGGGGDYTVSDTLPIGAVVEWYSNNIPNNWLVCNGQAVSRENYSELFGIIGTQYGSGDGSTTFNLPNLKGRVPVGLDPDDTDFNSLGKTGGQKDENLRAAIGATNSTTTRIGYVAEAKIPNINYTYSVLGSDAISNVPASAVNHSTLVLQTDGKNPSLLQPYLVSYYIIKAKQITPIIATVINNLSSTSTIDALAANQGRILKESIDANTISIDNINTNITNINSTLSDKPNKSELGTAAYKNVGTAGGNVPVLDGNGLLPDSVIPAVAITDTFVVNNKEEMLKLDAQAGDIAIRTDINTSFVLQQVPASELNNWVELLFPGAGVSSVNNKTGNVVLTSDDINVGNTSQSITTMLSELSNAIANAGKRYSSVIGNGTDTSFVINHNLNSSNCIIQVSQVASPHAVVIPDIELTSDNSCTIKFRKAPTASEFKVNIIG